MKNKNESTVPYERFEDTKGVIRSRKPKKDRLCNGQKKNKEKTMMYKRYTIN
jgi:hypothetical protein